MNNKLPWTHIDLVTNTHYPELRLLPDVNILRQPLAEEEEEDHHARENTPTLNTMMNLLYI